MLTSWDCAEEIRRQKDDAERKKAKAERRRRKAAAAARGVEAGTDNNAATHSSQPAAAKAPAVPDTPIAFLFPGQGSQVVGMLKVTPQYGSTVSTDSCACKLGCLNTPARYPSGLGM